MDFKFTKSGEKVLDIASNVAIYLGHNYIGSEHILYGLAKESDGLAHKVLKAQGINFDNIMKKIEDVIRERFGNFKFKRNRFYSKSKENS